MSACPLCGATARDQAGNVKHEGACPHFMRGPDPGGDPHEWPTILAELERLEIEAERLEPDELELPPAELRPHPAELDRWQTDPQDRDYLEPARRWCRVCTLAPSHPIHDPAGYRTLRLDDGRPYGWEELARA